MMHCCHLWISGIMLRLIVCSALPPCMCPQSYSRKMLTKHHLVFLLQPHANHSAHGSMLSLDAEGSPMDPYKENLRRVQSTDSLGSSVSAQQGLGGQNHKAKSASHLDETDFGPLVGADCGVTDTSLGETSSISSIKLTASHFLLTKDQEKAIKAMTPEQEETASLLSSISHAPDTAYLPPAGYRLVSDSEWNLLQQEVYHQGFWQKCCYFGCIVRIRVNMAPTIYCRDGCVQIHVIKGLLFSYSIQAYKSFITVVAKMILKCFCLRLLPQQVQILAWH